MLNTLQNGRYSFISSTLLVHSTNNLHQKSVLLPVNFHLPIPPFLVHKIILTIPNNNPLLYTSLFLRRTIPTIYTKNISLPHHFCQFRLCQETRDLGSLFSINTVLICPFLLKVWALITGITITDSLSLRIKKLIYFRCGKPSNLPSLIPSTYFHYFHALLILPQELTFPWKPVA